MRSQYKYLLVATVAIAGAGLGAYTRLQQTEPSASAADAPVRNLLSQTWPDASGMNTRLSDWQGKVLVINFWATWCAPCVKEMPELSALQKSLDPDRIRIVGIGINSAEEISPFARQHQIAYPLYASGFNGVGFSRNLGNQAGGLPFTVLVDKNGKVMKTYLGVKIDELKRDLAEL